MRLGTLIAAARNAGSGGASHTGRYVINIVIEFKSDLAWLKDPNHPGYDSNYNGVYTRKLRAVTDMTVNQASLTRRDIRRNVRTRGFRFRSDNTELVNRFNLKSVVAQYSYHGVFIIRVNNIQSTAQAKDDYRVIRAGYTNVQPYIDNEYAKAGTIRSDVYLPNACVQNLILELYKDTKRFQTKKMSALMNHDALYKLGTKKTCTGDYGMTVQQIAACLQALNVSYELITVDDMRICKGEGNKHSPKFRAVIGDAHAWAVTDDMCKSFDHKTRRGINDIIEPAAVKVINMKPIVEGSDIVGIINTTDDLVKILQNITESAHVLSNMDMDELIENLYKRGYKAGRLKIVNSMCDMLQVRVNKIIVSVMRAGDKHGYDVCDSVESANAYKKRAFKIQEGLMPAEGMSSYSPTLIKAHKTFPRVATVFNKCTKNTFIVGFDQVKAYGVIQRNMDILPVFCTRDEVIKTTEQATRAYCFYICYVHETDPYIAPTHDQFLYYETVDYLRARGRKVDIIAVLTPYKIVRINMKTKCNELVADPLLNKKQKKSILNSAYGLQARMKVKSRTGRVYQSQSECEATHQYMYTLGDLYVGYDDQRADLASGFVMNSRIILEREAMSIASMVSIIETVSPVVAFNTDCGYVIEADGLRVRAALVQAGYVFDPVQELNRETAGLRYVISWSAGLTTAEVRPCASVDVAIEERVPAAPIHMRDEWDGEEFKEIASRGNVLITGAVPGVGKTHMAVAAMMSGLVVTPWNKLGAVLKVSKGCHAITLHKLLGMNPEGEVIGHRYDVSEYTHIHFDEIYLLSVEQIVWVLDFIKANPDHAYTACGDSWQLAPINQDLTRDLDSYYRELLSECFTEHIELLINKRVTDPAESAKMYKLISYLKAGNVQAALSMLKSKALTNMTDDEITEMMNYPHVCFTNRMKDNINAAAHEKRGALKVGDTMSGIRGAKVKEHNILSNAPYDIVKRTTKNTTLIAPDKSYVMTLKNEDLLKSFNYSYCSTVHSVQGCSLGDNVMIWEYDHPHVTARWLLTAISRCGTLSGVTLMRVGEDETFGMNEDED